MIKRISNKPLKQVFAGGVLAIALGHLPTHAADFDMSRDGEWFDSDSYGYIAVSGGGVNSRKSWLQGGWDPFEVGSDGSFDIWYKLEAQYGFDMYLTESLTFHGQGVIRAEDASDEAESFGLVEAYLDYTFFDNDETAFSLRAGQYFMPTSQENTLDLWQSKYTLTYSAWNTWVAQEFRPIGFQLEYFSEFSEDDNLVLNLGVFQGNDSAGTQLAWNGWHMGSRLSVYDEKLPLANLFTLREGEAFENQRDDGSQPFGSDLDDEVGLNARIKYTIVDSFNLQLAWADNRGDRWLHEGGEYAWETKFQTISGQWQVNEQWEVLGEFANGSTGMGNGYPYVEADFSANYLMVSRKSGPTRVSLRFDSFDTEDVDQTSAETNDQNGHAWTIAWISEAGKNWRFAAEYVHFSSNWPLAWESGVSAETDADLLTFEVRYVF